jgi:hypothetical protein
LGVQLKLLGHEEHPIHIQSHQTQALSF